MQDLYETIQQVVIGEARGSAKAHFKKFQQKMGKSFPAINKRDHPEIRGLEGPFRFKSGRILYYDPKEGEYYDNTTDLYVSLKDIGER